VPEVDRRVPRVGSSGTALNTTSTVWSAGCPLTGMGTLGRSSSHWSEDEGDLGGPIVAFGLRDWDEENIDGL